MTPHEFCRGHSAEITETYKAGTDFLGQLGQGKPQRKTALNFSFSLSAIWSSKSLNMPSFRIRPIGQPLLPPSRFPIQQTFFQLAIQAELILVPLPAQLIGSERIYHLLDLRRADPSPPYFTAASWSTVSNELSQQVKLLLVCWNSFIFIIDLQAGPERNEKKTAIA